MKMLSSIASAVTLALNPHLTRYHGQRSGRKDEPSPIALQTALAAALETRDANMQKLIAKAETDIKSTGEIAASTRALLEKQASDGLVLQQRLTDMEQEFVKLRAGSPGDPGQFRTIGEMFTGSDDFKSALTRGASGFKGTINLSLKAVTNVTGTTVGTGAAGGAIPPDRLPGVIGPALRQFTIRDLIMPGRTSSNLIQYVRESGYQNMAASVAEGALKPQSDLSFELKDTSVKTLAHWLKASKQILADVPMLESYIDTRLRYGLKYVEEGQILAGDGIGENLLGLIPQATAYDALTYNVAGDTKIDTLRRAILQIRVAEYRASGIVLNPIEWAAIELTKSTTGEYIWVSVQDGGTQTMWRLPVIDTNAMPAGHFLVGAFNMAAQVFDREDANVQVSTEDGDNFVKNMVTIRAEERLGLVVYRPESFVYGAFP